MYFHLNFLGVAKSSQHLVKIFPYPPAPDSDVSSKSFEILERYINFDFLPYFSLITTALEVISMPFNTNLKSLCPQSNLDGLLPLPLAHFLAGKLPTFAQYIAYFCPVYCPLLPSILPSQGLDLVIVFTCHLSFQHIAFHWFELNWEPYRIQIFQDMAA